MKLVAIIVVVLCGLWFFMMLRGRKTIRAFVYLLMVSDGSTNIEANRIAFSVDLFAASKMQNQMLQFVNVVYNGSQLTMISEARLAGFKG